MTARNPLGWDPQIGIDAALGLLGWSCQRSDGGTADAALTRATWHRPTVNCVTH